MAKLAFIGLGVMGYPMAGHLARAGQETARLGEALARVRILYESEIDYRVEVLGALLQPLMLALISSIMIFTMTSIFLPLYAYMGSL